MGFQKEVRRDFRTKQEIAVEARGERLGAMLAELEGEIDRLKSLPDGEYRPADLHELEAALRRLADRAQVAGSTFIKRGK